MGWETLEDAEGKVVAAKRPPLGRTGPALDLAAFLRPSSGSSSGGGHTAAAQQSTTVEPSGSSNGSRATTRRPSLASQQSIGAQPQPQPPPPQVKVIRRGPPAVPRAASAAAPRPSEQSGHAAEAVHPTRALSAIRSAPPQGSVASAGDGAAKGSTLTAAPSPAAASEAAGVATGRERRKLEQACLPAHPARYPACMRADMAALHAHRAIPPVTSVTAIPGDIAAT